MSQNPPNDVDWAAQLVDTLESVIGAVKSKTTDPVTKLVRYLVFGLMAAGVGMATLLLLTIGLVRGLDAAIPGKRTIWAADLILGGIFLAIGSLAWRKRHRRA